MKKIEITLEQLWEALDKQYKSITMDKDGSITAWAERPNTGCLDSWDSGLLENCPFTICHHQFQIKEFIGKDWKECIAERPEPKPDYSKWAGKLCWFGDFTDECRNLGFLQVCCEYEDSNCFISTGGYRWKYCVPATKEEVLKYLVDETEQVDESIDLLKSCTTSLLIR